MNGCEKGCAAAPVFGGRELRAWKYMGSHAHTQNGQEGYAFRVWAPKAKGVAVVGDFNGWNPEKNPMNWENGGIWVGFVPGLERYDNYQYAVTGADGQVVCKADPFALHAEARPGKASKIYELKPYQWEDESWLKHRKSQPIYHGPVNVYELHLGSWRRTGEGEVLSYREIARWLVPYVKDMGFTHVELMPITEFPLDDSWGYQCTGYFAATSRFGEPEDLKFLIDQLHGAGVGVILDWVPAHFPKDAFGLYRFDGSACFEYADPRMGEHADWGTMVFDYGKPEVRAFLISSALFWLEEYHIDGLRVDAVASMLYRDYGRESGQWQPNEGGGRENYEAAGFLQKLNEVVFGDHPDVMMIAEESTSWPKVTHPTSDGGLGFNLKWNMGWMNDMLHYAKLDPYFRQFNHKDITFSFMYAFSENYMLPLSHDEVVHMKSSFLGKMPGSEVEKFAGVRAMYTYMMTHPGKKLLFMGAEFGQWGEWNFKQSLDWHLLEYEPHQQLQAYFKAMGTFYLEQPALWELDFSWEGFEWIEADDNNGNTAIFMRKDKEGKELIIAINFSHVHRKGYRVGLPAAGTYACIFNSNLPAFGGGGEGDREPLEPEDVNCHGREWSMEIDLPPMSGVIYSCVSRKPTAKKEVALREPVQTPVVKVKAGVPAVKAKAVVPAVKKKARVPAVKKPGSVPAVQKKPTESVHKTDQTKKS